MFLKVVRRSLKFADGYVRFSDVVSVLKYFEEFSSVMSSFEKFLKVLRGSLIVWSFCGVLMGSKCSKPLLQVLRRFLTFLSVLGVLMGYE